MLVSHTHRFVFVHVYKTGGTSIRRMLGSLCAPVVGLRNHATAFELRTHFAETQPEVLDYRWFSVVRNPFELNVSLWRHLVEQSSHPDHGEICRLDFPEFVEWLSAEGWSRCQQPREWHLVTSKPPPRYLTLEQFLCDEDGNLLVDDVLHTEQLESEFKLQSEHLGFKETLPHANQSDHSCYRDYYDATSRRAIEMHHQRDLLRFGYAY